MRSQVGIVFWVQEFAAIAIVFGEGLTILVIALRAFPAIDVLSLVFNPIDLLDPLPHAA